MKITKDNLEKIDYAILKTIEKHPTRNPNEILLNLIFEENPLKYISNKESAKDIISTLTRDEIIIEIAKYALKASMADNKIGHISDKKACLRFLDCLKVDKVPGDKILEYLKQNPMLLTEITNSFAKTRYKSKKNVDLKALDTFYSWYVEDYLSHLVNIQKKICRKATGLTVYEETVNRCRDDIYRGVQIKKTNVNYSLGKTMFASSDVGKKRTIQEDSVLLLRHPKNKHFKMLIVADGVGGYDFGGEASRYATQTMLNWFESLNKKYYYDIDLLQSQIVDELKKINNQILAFNDGRGTTFVGAIVGKEKTLIVSIGDSRAYITKNNELIQVSRDDSLVQRYFEQGIILEKDDMRFHYESNKVTQCLGMDETYKKMVPNIYFIDNSDYDTLILVSDGVTDCLSDDQIMIITTKTSREEIAKALVKSALENDSYRNTKSQEKEFVRTIYAGKDNTTAAVYAKKK